MKIGQQIKFIVINQQANSLYSLIADGQYRSTSLGRDRWKSLIGSEVSLQFSCNKEGFNAISTLEQSSRARIGILGNNELDECDSCDSRIGFGTEGYPINHNTCETWDITQVIMGRSAMNFLISLLRNKHKEDHHSYRNRFICKYKK